MCDGNFYPSHKLVLSLCSEYFHQTFRRVKCKHPFIFLTGINTRDLEYLLTLMYEGNVSVAREDLSSLKKAAECLQIEGSASLFNESPGNNQLSSLDKRSRVTHEDRTKAKRRKKSVELSHLGSETDFHETSADEEAVCLFENQDHSSGLKDTLRHSDDALHSINEVGPVNR